MDSPTTTVTFENLKTMSKSQRVFVVFMPQKKNSPVSLFSSVGSSVVNYPIGKFSSPAKARAFLPVFRLCPNDGLEEDGVLVAVPTSQTEGKLLPQGLVALQDACNRTCFHLFCLARWLFILQLREVLRFQIWERKSVRWYGQMIWKNLTIYGLYIMRGILTALHVAALQLSFYTKFVKIFITDCMIIMLPKKQRSSVGQISEEEKHQTSHGQKSKEEGRWCNLPLDIVYMILIKLSLEDYLRFISVCVPWRMAGLSFRLPLLPWLMLPYNRHSETRKFYSLTEEKTYSLKVEGAVGGWCCGQYGGWLILAFTDGRSSLLNPFSKAQTQLPYQFNLLSYRLTNLRQNESRIRKALKNTGGRSYLVKAVLSSLPTARNCIVAGIFSCGTSAICRPGDQAWTVVETDQHDPITKRRAFCDLVFHKGLLYAINETMELTIFDVGSNPKATKCNVYPPKRKCSNHRNTYLVESCGDLLIVIRLRTYFLNEGFFSEMRKNIVFKLDASGRHWELVKDLGNRLVFARNFGSQSLPADEFSDFEGIYFANDDLAALCHVKDPNFKIPYNMGDMQPSVWITPNMWPN